MIEFNPTDFKAIYTEFANTSDTILQNYWNMATAYANDDKTGKVGLKTTILQLYTAHFAKLQEDITDGTVSNMVTGGGAGAESVSLLPPPAKSEFKWWLNLTNYGQRLNALLHTKAVGGAYIGGGDMQTAFRKAGGFIR